MVVLILERVPASLRGELTRWMIEPKTGVFVGNVSAMVRDRLWELAKRGARGGSGMLLHSAQNEQGFLVRMYGDTSRDVRDWEGLFLPYITPRVRKEAIANGEKIAPASASRGDKGDDASESM